MSVVEWVLREVAPSFDDAGDRDRTNGSRSSNAEVARTSTSGAFGNAGPAAETNIYYRSALAQSILLFAGATLSASALLVEWKCLVSGRRRLPGPSHKFVVNLCAGNFLMTVLLAAFAVRALATDGSALEGVWCAAHSASVAVVFIGCTLSSAAVSVDRYVAIRHSLTYGFWLSPRTCTVVMISLWAISLSMGLCQFFGQTRIAYDSAAHACSASGSQQRGFYVLEVGKFLLGFLLPLAAHIFAYSAIFRAIRGSNGYARRSSVAQAYGGERAGGAGESDCVGGRPLAQRRSLTRLLKLVRREDRKAVRMGIAVVAAFVVTWFPVHGLPGVMRLASLEQLIRPYEWIFICSASLDSISNPLLYVISSKIVRCRLAKLPLFAKFNCRTQVSVSPKSVPRRYRDSADLHSDAVFVDVPFSRQTSVNTSTFSFH